MPCTKMPSVCGMSTVVLRTSSMTGCAACSALRRRSFCLTSQTPTLRGKMKNSELCQYGRSKEKRDDCKIVVAAVVNTLVRTMIYEGNRHDSTTLEEVVGTLARTTIQDAKRIIMMDACFYSKSNVNRLKDNGFDNITVLPSGDSKFESVSYEIIDHTDNKGQQICL